MEWASTGMTLTWLNSASGLVVGIGGTLGDLISKALLRLRSKCLLGLIAKIFASVNVVLSVHRYRQQAAASGFDLEQTYPASVMMKD